MILKREKMYYITCTISNYNALFCVYRTPILLVKWKMTYKINGETIFILIPFHQNLEEWLFLNNNFEVKVHKNSDETGNLLALDLTIENKCMSLITIYGPNDDTPIFYKGLSDII